ncbi:T9SS type A sorting domain-containing protein [Fodinibius salsisoli]|uniref:T9SS type A sorting domain-containing protein n=1 Tax=Fodinibius salsisoli TaxID=2820877 RepID=A0ABT3PJ82_9BACT|nr:T9SS type A sorting domain-containing protein [Fodinibius salsisoli]MCW9705997.1 T9SS type A sorting domain-containing protein [Fodinibius salsisoli]
MNKYATKRLLILAGVSLLLVLGGLFYFHSSSPKDISLLSAKNENYEAKLSELDKMDRIEKKEARADYFFRLMRDPATNAIPENIRNRELDFARSLPSIQQLRSRAKAKNPSFQAVEYSWSSAGPFDLGGRTRALAADQRNPDILLAGGVSGGMWKSTNRGLSWQLRTPDLPNLSVTSVAQDPLNPDTWYYASGEVLGNSASATGAAYYGEGIYKSTDNGDSWSLLPQTNSSDISGLVAPFNTVSRIIVSPTTGSVFASSTGFGIYKSTDGETFSGPILGTAGEQLFTDVAVASDGTLGAVISEAAFDDQQSTNPNTTNHTPGIFISTNDGSVWIDITPKDFPTTHRRSVLTFAPSNPDILYVLTLKGANNNTNQGISFFKINISDPSNPIAEDRSANLPDFRDNSGDGSGYMEMQGGYNMTVAVKPDDEDYVFVGGTNLFRSTDGFASVPAGGYDETNTSLKNEFWIGGYNKGNTFAQYPKHHPDQHRVVFPEPVDNPNLMMSGHDGGLSYTSDVSASSVAWVNRDDNYVTSQFYTSALPETSGDNRIMGGTQDNGTPLFQAGQPQSEPTVDISSGDGGYSFFTEENLFVSQQNGTVLRWTNDFSQLAYVYPSEADGQLFIHPYEIDPNDANIMYYPENDHLWRNTSLSDIPNSNSSSGASEGWEELPNLTVGNGYIISTLETSIVPANVLFLGGYSPSREPVIKHIRNAHTTSSEITDISLPSEPSLSGAYIKDIAVNPANINEILVVLSNYNIVGLYRTTDGGENWTAVEGNLTGNENNPGPSLRAATIIPAEAGVLYLLATSTGLYSTQSPDGSNTQWGQEAQNVVGNVVTEHLSMRISDGDVAAGTHGRGMLSGNFEGIINIPDLPTIQLDSGEDAKQPGEQVVIRALNFSFSPTLTDNEVMLIDTFEDQTQETPAEVIETNGSELTLRIPRDATLPNAPDNEVQLSIKVGDTAPPSIPFTVLPPNRFSLNQNFPNPFRGTTNISFDVAMDSEITLIIYSINGQKVQSPIHEQTFNAGTYNQQIDLSNLASGVYIFRIIAKSGGQTQIESKKMTLIK